MRMKLIRTGGYDAEAEIEISGRRIRVLDRFSAPGQPSETGPLGAVRFRFTTAERLSPQASLLGNRKEERKIQHLSGLSYLGLGEVVSISPVIIDFGFAQMEDGDWLDDESKIGRFICVKMDRLELWRSRLS